VPLARRKTYLLQLEFYVYEAYYSTLLYPQAKYVV